MKHDAIIFDMDGTLWDAVDSYAEIWNRTLADCGVARRAVTRDELIALMGHPLKEISSILVPSLGGLGGRLYPGVRDTIAALHAAGTPMYMVSNCGPDGLPMFLDYTGLRPFIADTLSYGHTGVEKDVNIRTLMQRYTLTRPLYVGDTRGDLLSTRRAGAAFSWASYGFGLDFDAADADYVLNTFSDLKTIFE